MKELLTPQFRALSEREEALAWHQLFEAAVDKSPELGKMIVAAIDAGVQPSQRRGFIGSPFYAAPMPRPRSWRDETHGGGLSSVCLLDFAAANDQAEVVDACFSRAPLLEWGHTGIASALAVCGLRGALKSFERIVSEPGAAVMALSVPGDGATVLRWLMGLDMFVDPERFAALSSLRKAAGNEIFGSWVKKMASDTSRGGWLAQAAARAWFDAPYQVLLTPWVREANAMAGEDEAKVWSYALDSARALVILGRDKSALHEAEFAKPPYSEWGALLTAAFIHACPDQEWWSTELPAKVAMTLEQGPSIFKRCDAVKLMRVASEVRELRRHLADPGQSIAGKAPRL